MKLKQYIGLAAIMLPLAATSQTPIDFETDGQGYTKIGVYDSWENSPFRTGKLNGNVQIIKNHLTETDPLLGEINSSERILGFQRSRFASNVFGARIDLSEPFEMSSTTRYVHVMIHKQTTGRVMLVGLGKRQDRPNQKPEVEQFNVLSSSTVKAGKWYDAVFPISGTKGVDIYSLVVVPECEPTHNMTADEVIYIDNIEVNNSSRPRITYGYYPVNVEKTDKLSRTDRYTNSISLQSPSAGAQTITTNQQTNKLVYIDALDSSFQVKAGESVTPTIGYNSTWMHGYVYIDRKNDGRFDYELNADLSFPDDCDLMSYSCYNNKNSNGGSVNDNINNTNAAVQPPAFTIPADLANGFYRMRYKVDWDNIDPAGSSEQNNDITANGGIIVDTRLNVHGDEVNLTRGQHALGTNGEVKTGDGENWPATIPFGKPFTFKVVPSPGFTFSHVVIRHGYNLSGDSLVYETPQYEDVIIPGYLFRDNTYTVPAEYIDGDVRITPYFPEDKGSSEVGEDYPLNFSKDLAITRTDRYLNSFTVAGSTSGSRTVTIKDGGTNHVYRALTSKEFPATQGETVNITANYYGDSMHMYFYVDYSMDGQFNTDLDASGKPTFNSELVSYTYYKGFNSQGNSISNPGLPSLFSTMPSFTIPASLPAGVYRARLKIDWDNIDAAGQWSEGGKNQIDKNGGYVIDFLLNVHDPQHNVQVITENGSINGSDNTGLPLTQTPFQTLTVVPTPAVEGYVADELIIKHGHNFDGPQYIHGNRQWSEYTVDATSYTLPADSVNGDLLLTARFEETADSKYKLVFADEFDGEDGSQPNETFWSRSQRNPNATWARWISNSDEVIYVKDGNLVARAIPNPDTSTDNVAMITGAVESAGKFSFMYGKIEGRILTNPHTGNFPAFWMMPEDQSDSWPTCGEIDIWEQIDNENTSYQTVHSHWTYDLGYRNDPQSSFNCSTTMDRYHTYGFQWNATTLTWFVDGKQVASYTKKVNDQNALNQGQWPFSKAFHIILNQSVGNGSWAQPADEAHTYETFFDWVRVYQLKDDVSIGELNSDAGLEVAPSKGNILLYTASPLLVSVYDTAGRPIFKKEINGYQNVPATPGVYVVNGRKVLVP